jgi:transposase
MNTHKTNTDLLNTIESLLKENVELKERNAELEERIAQLEAIVEKLQERINTNSQNSSKSPSQDPYRKRGSKKEPSKRKKGGQPGHQGHCRKNVPPEEVSEIHNIHPLQCPNCGNDSFDDPSQTEERQVIELPEFVAYVVQYNIHTCKCLNCNNLVSARIPPEATKAFGPRLMGFVSAVTVDFGLSKRKVCKLLSYLNVRISVGSVTNIHKLATNILEFPCEEIKERLHQQESINADETSWYRDGKRKWLWLATSLECSFFMIDGSRNREAFERLLGRQFKNPITTDRYAVYDSYDGPQQKCWAHLARDFEKIAQRSSPDNFIGGKLLEASDAVFKMRCAFKQGNITKRELQIHMYSLVCPVVKDLLLLGYVGGECKDKTKGTCKRLLLNFDALWTYLEYDNVEPTNNEAERQLRPAVIWRKLSYGNRSDWGELFVSRLLSVSNTLSKQSRSLLHYLESCFRAHCRDGPIPGVF